MNLRDWGNTAVDLAPSADWPHDMGMSRPLEHCERCKETTRTALPPVWARRIGLILFICTMALPLIAPFLASDPVVTIVSFLGLGMAVGPVAVILRTRGSCAECHLDRAGLAVKRLGFWHFFGSTPRL